MPINEPDWEALHQVLLAGRFSDEKPGICKHWIQYSVPAIFDGWYLRHPYQGVSINYEHNYETYGECFGDKDFIPELKTERFDPEEWVELFHEAGVCYVMAVAEHRILKIATDCIHRNNHLFPLEEA
jgi:alpha-L-fucosidase